jgi:carbon-monoxide dehydrogenase catalytic subunit
MSDTKDKKNQAVEMIDLARSEGISTAHLRTESMRRCPIGVKGACCKNCFMGPCNLFKSEQGVCGATADTVAARNFARMIAAGCAAHVDHAREVVNVFIGAAKGELQNYKIKDEKKLHMLAQVYGIKTEDRDKNEIAVELGEQILAEFGEQSKAPKMIQRAPKKRQQLWQDKDLTPRGIDREIVEMVHRTTVGTDQDPMSLLLHGTRTALANGWGGSMAATELQDILLGTPSPVKAKANLGVLEAEQVNVVVHGHDPLLAEMIVEAVKDEDLQAQAKAKGAKGINVAGICCTANEVLLRHGVPMVGSFTQQELAVLTGAVEVMAVAVANCFHTKIVTTSPKAKITGATHIEMHEETALEQAKEIVKVAIDNFPNRKKVNIPDGAVDMVVGFTHETIEYMLGGSFRSSYRPLNDNIINGRILGVAGVVGCNLPHLEGKGVTSDLVKELIANDVLVVQTGCATYACANENLLTPEAALKYAGPGLTEVCEAVGIPPVLHSGSCVDNSRILIACAAMVAEGGLGDDLGDLPVVGCAPEWMSEKAVAIGQYFVASGALVVFGSESPVGNSACVSDLLGKGFEKITGGRWVFEPDPHKMAQVMIEAIKAKRKALGIEQKQERVLYDMEMRRELQV